MKRNTLMAAVFLLSALFVQGEEGSSLKGLLGSVPFEKLLKSALLLHTEISVKTANEGKIFWEGHVSKITIPGRAVNISLKKSDAKLSVFLTVYPAEGNELLLVAHNEVWIKEEYSSSFSSLPMEKGQEIDYYPLGRAGKESKKNPVEIIMKIKVVPYLETLDKKERDSLKFVFEPSSEFDLSGEAP